MKTESYEVAIIGAGPAGLTLAALLAKYRPETSVLVLEKKRFPRYRIGESLIIDINRVLQDMGCMDEVDAAGFVPKYGSTFVWGDDRTPRTFVWPDWQEAGYPLPYTWHVERPVYDQILADCALGHGAQEQPRDPQGAALRRHDEGRGTAVVGQVWVSAGSQQGRRGVVVAALARPQQRGDAAVFVHVRVGAGLEQALHHGGVPPS